MKQLCKQKKINFIDEGFVTLKKNHDGHDIFSCNYCNYIILNSKNKGRTTPPTSRISIHLTKYLKVNSDELRIELLSFSKNKDVQKFLRRKKLENQSTTSITNNLLSGNGNSGTHSNNNDNNSSLPSSNKQNTHHQRGIDDVFNHCTKEIIDQIMYAIAKMFTTNALPFSLVESPYFIEMIRALNVAYVKYLRKRKSFGEKYLEQI